MLHAARWKYGTQKNCQKFTIAQLRPAVFLQLRCVLTIGKNLLNSNIASTCPHNMANFVPLMAEIGSGVWGTPANFNGFHVLASLLQRFRSPDRSTKLCTMFGRLLGCCTMYTFSAALLFWRTSSTCKLQFASNSCVLLYWQRHCTGVSQTLWRGTRNRITELSQRAHLYLAGRPSWPTF